jgi:hypothetical protein
MVRRFSLALLPLLFLFIAACNPKQILPPDEVLRRTILRSSSVDSVLMNGTVSMSLDGPRKMSGSSLLHMSMQNGGMAWSVRSDVRFTGPLGERSSGMVDIRTADSHQFFVRFDETQGSLFLALQKTMSGSLQDWKSFGDPVLLQAIGRHTPTPQELESAAAIFRIDQSSPPKRGDEGRLEYTLDVTLTDDALLKLFPPKIAEKTHIFGTLVIDAKNFTLHRARWTVEGIETDYGTVKAIFEVTLRDFDHAPEISLPHGSTAMLPLKDIFATFSL